MHKSNSFVSIESLTALARAASERAKRLEITLEERTRANLEQIAREYQLTYTD